MSDGNDFDGSFTLQTHNETSRKTNSLYVALAVDADPDATIRRSGRPKVSPRVLTGL